MSGGHGAVSRCATERIRLSSSLHLQPWPWHFLPLDGSRCLTDSQKRQPPRSAGLTIDTETQASSFEVRSRTTKGRNVHAGAPSCQGSSPISHGSAEPSLLFTHIWQVHEAESLLLLGFFLARLQKPYLLKKSALCGRHL